MVITMMWLEYVTQFDAREVVWSDLKRSLNKWIPMTSDWFAWIDDSRAKYGDLFEMQLHANNWIIITRLPCKNLTHIELTCLN